MPTPMSHDLIEHKLNDLTRGMETLTQTVTEQSKQHALDNQSMKDGFTTLEANLNAKAGADALSIELIKTTAENSEKRVEVLEGHIKAAKKWGAVFLSLVFGADHSGDIVAVVSKLVSQSRPAVVAAPAKPGETPLVDRSFKPND